MSLRSAWESRCLLIAELEMDERALLVGLVRTLTAVPSRDWAVGDLECLRGHLQRVVEAGGLTREARTAAASISSALGDSVQQCSDHLRLASSVILADIDKLFHERCKESWVLDVTVQSPSVSCSVQL